MEFEPPFVAAVQAAVTPSDADVLVARESSSTRCRRTARRTTTTSWELFRHPRIAQAKHASSSTNTWFYARYSGPGCVLVDHHWKTNKFCVSTRSSPVVERIPVGHGLIGTRSDVTVVSHIWPNAASASCSVIRQTYRGEVFGCEARGGSLRHV